MNLTERLGEKKILWCPFSEAGACVIKNADGESVREPNECAHYNPETDECFHVEEARAQVDAAKALTQLAEILESARFNKFWRGDGDA